MVVCARGGATVALPLSENRMLSMLVLQDRFDADGLSFFSESGVEHALQ